jgi:ABC-2 type transport system ATP-binding protein
MAYFCEERLMNSYKAIELVNVSKTYPAVNALDDVSFCTSWGNIHGLLGPNGSGKTTSMKIITGLLAPTLGEVLVGGKKIEARQLPIGFLPENPPLYEDMKVIDYLKFLRKVRLLQKFEISKSTPYEIDELLQTCGLLSVVNRFIKNLSKGFKQRVGLAQAIMMRPEIIILDEPMVGLDPNAILEMRKIIKGLENKHSILFSSHQLSEVEQLCSHVTLLDSGKVSFSGTLFDLKNRSGQKNEQVIEILVSTWNLEIEKKITSQFHLEVQKVQEINQNGQSHISVKLKFNSSKDHRGELSKFIFDNGIDLFGLEAVSKNLEEVFTSVTH